MDAAQNAYDVTTPLLRLVPQSALDSIFGASGLVTPDLKLSVVGRAWDEFMARSGRSDLTRNALLGSSILLFFRNDEQRRVFESLLHSMHSDELGVHNQVVDLGTKEKPFYVQLHVQGLWQEGVFAGYFLHCLDITREHTNRLTLIERDRELLAARDAVEKSQQQGNTLQEKLKAATEEIAQREAQLRKMTEKSMRMEKSSKDAMERAEKSVEKSTRLQHELDKLKKQVATSSDSQAQMEAQQAELAKLTQELTNAKQAATRFEQEFESLQEAQGNQAGEMAAAAQELVELRTTLLSLREQQSSSTTEQNELQQQLAQSQEQVANTLTEHNDLKQALAKSQEQIAALQTALNEAQQATREMPEPVVSAADEFVLMLSQAAGYLDANGKLVCATGSFWEKLGTLPAQALEQPLVKWLSKSDAQAFVSWLKKREETSCDVTAANGSLWRACAVTGDDGSLRCVTVEELVPEIVREAALTQIITVNAGSPLQTQVRVLSRELADEFSNLLTGVLGHASLAASELDGNTSRDIVAIEKTAREAAQLVRKLSALGGSGRHLHESDLAALVKQFVKKLQPGFYEERPQLVVCDDGCKVAAEVNSLRMLLEAISAHAKDHLSGSGQVCYTLSHTDEQACLSLSFEGSAGYPAGWGEGLPPTMGQNGWDLIFAREVVRGMGGELELSEDSGRAMLLATIPLVRQTANA